MKNTLFILSLSLALASLCLALPSNTTLLDLSRAQHAVKVALATTTRQFEVALVGGGATPVNKAALQSILEQSKRLSMNITTLQVDYASVLGSVDSYFAGNDSLDRKMSVQRELAQLNAFERQLSAIQREVLALLYLENSRHPQYVPSERLVMAAYLLSGRMMEAGKKISEVDKLFNKAKHANGSQWLVQELPMHLPAAIKAKVIKLLGEFATETQAIMAAIETEYYGEVERLRLQGKRLSLEVQTTFEGAFDVMAAEVVTAHTLVQELEKHAKVFFLF